MSTTAHGATVEVASCAYDDVQRAVDAAASSDTVIVPPGECEWDQTLVVDKGIVLQGAGAGSTVIRAGSGIVAVDGLLAYVPADPVADEPFRLTGFTLDMRGLCNGIRLSNTSTSPLTRVRVDHNVLQDAGGENAGRKIVIRGTVYGVIDSNEFLRTGSGISSYGLHERSWNELTFEYGSADNIYYEDNVFVIETTAHAAGHGGRYAARSASGRPIVRSA